MNDVITIFGGVIAVVIICSVFKSSAPGYAVAVNLILGLFILRRAAGIMYPTVLYVRELLGGEQYNKYIMPAVKALGIAAVTHITCETCRDLGENSIASKTELLGKAAILLCSIPVMKELFALVNSFLY